MRSSLPAELLLLSSCVQALPEISIGKRDRHSNGKTADVAKGVVKRQEVDGTLETNVFNIVTYTTGGAYYANVSVGTPGQLQTVILDTGSSDLYFDSSTARACQGSGPYSCRGGEFTQADSDTYEIVLPDPAFDTEFGDGSTASGPFARDTVCISDICVTNVQFGLATKVKSTTGYALGLLGLGYSQNEATHHEYPNVPEVLVSAGEIDSRLYSVYLNDWRSTTGSILFGGIDTTKYSGPLQTLDLLPNVYSAEVDQFVTTVTDMTVTVGGRTTPIFSGGAPDERAYRNNNDALPVLLDTGSAAWSVPTSYFPYIVNPFEYLEVHNGGQTTVTPCSNAERNDKITLTFGGVIDITIPVSELIVPIYDPQNNSPVPWPTDESEDACAFMIIPSEGTGMGFDVMGDPILRSMYVVFDLDNGQVSIAQANVNSTDSPNIKSVAAGPNGVANAAGSSHKDATGQQRYPIASEIPHSATYQLTTVKTAIGEATGAAAIPADAQTSSQAGEDGDESSGVATPLRLPGADWSCVWVCGLAGLMAVLGGGLIL